MNGFPWLTVAGAVPLLGALVIMALPGLPTDGAEADRVARNALAKWLALAFSLATLVVVLVIAIKFQVGGPNNYQFTEIYSWIPAFGVHYALGVDGIALVLIAMSAVLMPVVILASWHDAESGRHSVKTYFALMLVLETMMIGVFAATDVFLFHVFFIAFAIKAPLWPFHTWLPDAAASAPPGAAVLLVGVLDKVGTFGMLRYCFELFPSGAKYFTPLVITLSVIGILYGAIVAIGPAA